MKIEEVELKILEVDLAKLIVSLETLGAVRMGESTIFDVYYERSQGTGLKAESKGVRVRYKQGKKIITLKKRLTKATDTVKRASEEEYEFHGHEEKSMLENNSLTPSWIKYKRRITYTHGDVQFDIDLYPGIPPLLEIEASQEKDIHMWIKKLGLEEKDLSVRGTRGLFKRYGKKPVPILG